MSKPSPYRNASLEKGLAVLSEVVASPSPLGVAAIAQRLSLDYSTTYRLVATLEGLGYVARDPQNKLCEPGRMLERLGLVTATQQRLIRAARPVMEELVARLGETVHLSRRDGDRLVLLDAIEGTHLLTTRTAVGGTFPMHCTASGKCILAFMAEAERAALLSDLSLPAMTPRSITERGALERQLAEVRRRGYATNEEEHAVGLAAVAAPIVGRRGEVLATLDVSVPTARVTRERPLTALAHIVTEAAARIAATLGGAEPT